MNPKIYTVKEFAQDVEDGYITPYDGTGYYEDKTQIPTNGVFPKDVFDADAIRSSNHIHVYWIGR